jgi:hypothetical protein
MKVFMKVDLNILHNFCIGHFDQRSTIFKRKKEKCYGIEFRENSLEFILNLVQTRDYNHD